MHHWFQYQTHPQHRSKIYNRGDKKKRKKQKPALQSNKFIWMTQLIIVATRSFSAPYGIFARSCVAMAKDAKSTFQIIDDEGWVISQNDNDGHARARHCARCLLFRERGLSFDSLLQ